MNQCLPAWPWVMVVGGQRSVLYEEIMCSRSVHMGVDRCGGIGKSKAGFVLCFPLHIPKKPTCSHDAAWNNLKDVILDFRKVIPFSLILICHFQFKSVL